MESKTAGNGGNADDPWTYHCEGERLKTTGIMVQPVGLFTGSPAGTGCLVMELTGCMAAKTVSTGCKPLHASVIGYNTVSGAVRESETTDSERLSFCHRYVFQGFGCIFSSSRLFLIFVVVFYVP